MLYDFWASRRQFWLSVSDWFNFRIGSCLSSATGPCCLSHDLDSGGRNVEFSLMPSQVKGAGLNTHCTSVSTGSCPAGVQGFESPPPHHTIEPPVPGSIRVLLTHTCKTIVQFCQR